MNEANDVKEEKVVPPSGFLGDLTDGRRKGDWKSRYDVDCQRHIKWEKKYLIYLISGCLIIPLLIGVAANDCFWGLTCGFGNLKKYAFAFFGGTLGGTLFAVKWLVHSVAKNTWSLDRRLWRIFTPFLSGSLAFIVVLLINASLFNGDGDSFSNLTIHKSYGIGFLVGYFSDNAIGKLTEIAQVFFGSSISQRK